MKVLTVCRQGLVRSVALADVLKLHFRDPGTKQPVDALPAGHFGNSKETLQMLFDWADRIVVMEDHYRKYVPEMYHDKLLICDVGPDVDNPQGSKTRKLIDFCWNWLRQHVNVLGIEEHTDRL